MILRPYQHECIEAVKQHFGIHDAVLVEAATGVGKTVIFSHLAHQWKSGRILVIAHRDELIRQATEKIHAITGEQPGIEMGQERVEEHGLLNKSRVLVSSVQTMCRPGRHAKFKPEEFGLVIIDEAHHVVANSYRQVIEWFRKNTACKLLGVTATPKRADDLALGQVFESVAFRYGINRAVDDGWLVPVIQQCVRVEGLDFSKVKSVAGDFNEGELEKILTEESILHKVAAPVVDLAGDRPALLFCCTVKHAELMAAVLERYKPHSAAWLSGASRMDERRATVERYKRGELQFLCNCLDEETELLTQEGWKCRPEVSENQLVASMVVSTGEMEWVPVLSKIERPRGMHERMVSLETPRISFRVTEGHRMAYRVAGGIGWKIDTAYQLAMRDSRFQLPMACQGKPAYVDEPPGCKPAAELTLAECRFIGLFVSDGCLAGGSRGVVIGQSRRNQWVIDEIVSTLDACGFDWKQSVKIVPNSIHEQVSFRIPRGNIGGSLARQGWDHLAPYLEKSGCDLWWGLNREQWLAFIEGFWLGDGCKDRRWLIVNTDLRLLELVQAISSCRGLAASLSPPKDNGPLATKPIYRLSLRDREYITTNLTTTTKLEDADPSETVWCVSNRNGTIITRRHGKVVVMGQCGLFLEGFDAPSTAVVIMARPTKSLVLYAQVLGRGTRPLPGTVDGLDSPEERKAAIAQSDKPGMLALDFVGNAGRHKIVTAADVLGGKYGIPVRDYARQTVSEEQRPVPVADALDRAEAELDLLEEERQRRRRIVARAEYRMHEVSPFDTRQGTTATAQQLRVADPPTDKQIWKLRQLGVREETARSYSKRQASAVISKLLEEKQAG